MQCRSELQHIVAGVRRFSATMYAPPEHIVSGVTGRGSAGGVVLVQREQNVRWLQSPDSERVGTGSPSCHLKLS